jgi:hypothetical protein
MTNTYVKIPHEDMRQHCSDSEVDIHRVAKSQVPPLLTDFASNYALI